jgi:hypothetical protein
MNDLIIRQAVIDAIDAVFPVDPMKSEYAQGIACGAALAKTYVEQLPSAQPERDIPIKPIETTDTAWGIPNRQAVCPKCDYYLGHVNFIGDSKRITYCETCGQAIDWEGWEQE